MRNSRIRYLLTIWVILFVSIFTCNAQQIDTVYMNKIASSFKQITNLPQEKVYLHTDKPYYFVGDTIWLKAYLVNAITHFSGNGSQYVYVELINRKDKVLQRIKIQQDKDLFASYLTLPKTLEAGDYYLRAYTHWMLNEDSSFYFSKNLKILASQSSFMYPEIRYEQKGKKRTAIITFKRPDNGVYAGNYVHYMVRTKTHENKFRQQQTNKNGEIQKSNLCRRTGMKEKYLVRTRLNAIFRKEYATYFGFDRDYNTTFEVYAVLGCCFLMTRECAQKVTPLDEHPFLYEEELILGIQMEQAGYHTVYDADAVIEHLHGGSTKNVKAFSFAHNIKSEIYYCKAYLKASNAAIYPLYWYRVGLYLIRCLKYQDFREHWKWFRQITREELKK